MPETTDATTPFDSTGTRTDHNSSNESNDTRHGGNGETTIDDPPLTSSSTSDPSTGAVSTQSESLASTSTFSTTTTTTTTTTTSESSSSSSSTTSDTTSDSSTETTVERCNNPTLCYETNPGRSVNFFGVAAFDSFAIPIPTTTGPLNVARVDVYTGSLLGTHIIAMHPNQPSNSGFGVEEASFSATVFQRWYAASFDLPIRVSESTPYWVAWRPPAGSLGSAATFGRHIDGEQKNFESSPWRPESYPLKMRVYCCP